MTEQEPIDYEQGEIIGENPVENPDVPMGEVRFRIPLKAGEFDMEEEKIIRPKALNKIRDFFQENPKASLWLEKLGVDIESGKVNARFYATVGTLIFTIGVGVELGIRKGEDVRKLVNYFREFKKKA